MRSRRVKAEGFSLAASSCFTGFTFNLQLPCETLMKSCVILQRVGLAKTRK